MGQPWWWNEVGGGRDEIVFAFENLVVKRIGKLIELNDGITKFASFKSSIKVVITYAGRIIDFSRFLGWSSSSHESDHIDWCCLKEP